MRPLRLLLPLLLLLSQPALSQSVRLALGGGTAGHVQLALLDQRLPSGRASLGVHYRGGLGVAVHLRNTTTFGPLGNVIVDLDALAEIAAGVDLAASARATAGPFALRLRAHVATAPGLPRLREDDGNFPARPAAGTAPVWGVQLGATYRASRELQVLFDPSLVAVTDGLSLLLPLELQLQRFLGDQDLRLQVSTLVPLTRAGGGTVAWSAAGAGIRIDRGRAAAWNAWLLVGGNSRFLSPGFRLGIQDALAGGQLRASLWLEPWRSDLEPLRLRVQWDGPVSGVELAVHLEAAAAGATAGNVRAGLGLSWPLH